MENERTIGKVVYVESERVTVELDSSSKSLTKTFLTGTYPVARLNSYVLIPVGSVSIVGIVTRVSMREQDLEVGNQASITLAQPKRTLSVTMVGTIKKENGQLKFEYGIRDFPALNNPVWFILEQELDVIFDKKGDDKYFIELGHSTAYPEYKVKLDPTKLFSRHLAVLGNTGGGKSCTIASLMQTILTHEDVVKGKGAHFIIFDTNGEYKDAFDKGGEKYDMLHIGQSNLKIPYWLMNFQDWRQLLNPGEGSQISILHKGLLYARNPSLKSSIRTFLDIQQLLDDIRNHYRNKEKFEADEEKRYLDVMTQQRKDDLVKYVKEYVKGKPIENKNYITVHDVDMPNHYDISKLKSENIERAIQESGSEASRIRGFCETMLQRLERYTSDPRYDFLFHPFKEDFGNSLANFLRMCFGRMENIVFDAIKENVNNLDEEYFLRKYYESNQKNPKQNYQVIIFDLSLVPYDVLENITALLGRVILEFLQRIEKVDKYKGKDTRGKFPAVLVLEEAHNYIPEFLPKDKESVSKSVFERIAREGRKYGLSLVVSSQRPSELSKTVLSQCNSFITHRIQNPEDQLYIKKLLPTISHDLLNQLPILAQGVSLIFGDCVRAPMEVYVRKPNPEPKSHDPDFWKHWTNRYEKGEDKFDNGEPDFEDVCRVWEGGKLQLDDKSVYKDNQLPGTGKPQKNEESA